MAMKRMVLELGMGTDIRGLDDTKAAVRALRDALWHNSLTITSALGVDIDSMVVDITIGTPHPERVYRAADIFVYPSPYEPFGMVVTEAMASGLACIVGRQVGAAELMTDGRDGFLMDSGDAPALRRHLETLSGDPANALRVGIAARETIQHHDWDACAEATWRVYRAAGDGAILGEPCHR